MGDVRYSRLLCSPRPTLDAALGCCDRPRLSMCDLRDHVHQVGAAVKGQLVRLGADTVPRVTGLLHYLPRVFCTHAPKFSEGSFLERLPSAVVGQASTPVITEGPHKIRVEHVDGAAVEQPCGAGGETRPGPPEAPPPATSPGDAYRIISDVICTLRPPSPDDIVTSECSSDAGEQSATDNRALTLCETAEPSVIGGSVGAGSPGLVVIRLRPDQHGRYGFNVKGGVESGAPVTVSKVAPHLAANSGTPRLNEGDQVALVNGVDVSTLTHDEVVHFIKSCRDLHHELILAIKPNVNYEGCGCDLDEPLVRYVPDTTAPVSLTALPGTSPLTQSVAALAEAVNSGSARLKFDKLARRVTGLTMDDCRLPHNVAKNRYRDISPYDATRVHLCSSESGDYINANYVTMEIAGSGIVNRYIAAQGPLKHTTDDFWALVWEQQCPLVVMLTTLVEQGRVKCHHYWPPVGESRLHDDLEVTCTNEEVTESFAFREITLVSQETGEERHISHMQYLSWPDHGVPDEAADFVRFVQRVRAARAGQVEPTVVHCSAGIGRTGVLILMETAMCQIEANQPVHPLQLVDTMRAQRAMMVQTSSQFQFVCQALLQVYEEGTVRPLAEYSQR